MHRAQTLRCVALCSEQSAQVDKVENRVNFCWYFCLFVFSLSLSLLHPSPVSTSSVLIFVVCRCRNSLGECTVCTRHKYANIDENCSNFIRRTTECSVHRNFKFRTEIFDFGILPLTVSPRRSKYPTIGSEWMKWMNAVRSVKDSELFRTHKTIPFRLNWHFVSITHNYYVLHSEWETPAQPHSHMWRDELLYFGGRVCVYVLRHIAQMVQSQNLSN